MAKKIQLDRLRQISKGRKPRNISLPEPAEVRPDKASEKLPER